MKKHKKLIIILSSIFGFILLCVLAFFIYVSDYYRANDYALNHLNSDDKVEVIKEDDNYVFSPKKETTTGLIFYPGGKVEMESYAPLMYEIAYSANIKCILAKVAFNLAFLSMNKADSIKEKHTEIKDFYLSGHSLGGVAAGSYLSSHLNEYKGMIFLASYTTSNLTKSSTLKCLTIRGSNDKVLDIDSYNENKTNLPSLTEKIINGGNHAYYGCYGNQAGDGEASITNEEQISITTNYIKEFIS